MVPTDIQSLKKTAFIDSIFWLLILVHTWYVNNYMSGYLAFKTVNRLTSNHNHNTFGLNLFLPAVTAFHILVTLSISDMDATPPPWVDNCLAGVPLSRNWTNNHGCQWSQGANRRRKSRTQRTSAVGSCWVPSLCLSFITSMFWSFPVLRSRSCTRKSVRRFSRCPRTMAPLAETESAVPVVALILHYSYQLS